MVLFFASSTSEKSCKMKIKPDWHFCSGAVRKWISLPFCCLNQLIKYKDWCWKTSAFRVCSGPVKGSRRGFITLTKNVLMPLKLWFLIELITVHLISSPTCIWYIFVGLARYQSMFLLPCSEFDTFSLPWSEVRPRMKVMCPRTSEWIKSGMQIDFFFCLRGTFLLTKLK